MQTGNIFVLISYYLKTVVYFTGPEMTEQKFVNRPLSKSLFESCILFIFILFTVSLFITLSHMGKFLRASEVISRVTKWKGEWGMIANESQFNCIRKKRRQQKQKNIHKAEQTLTIRVKQPGCKHTSSSWAPDMYHLGRCKYRLSTPPNLIFTLLLWVEAGHNVYWSFLLSIPS